LVGFRRTQYIKRFGGILQEWGVYDIVVFFDFEVFWGVFVLEGGRLLKVGDSNENV